MDVGGNDALGGDAAGLLVGAREALLAQPLHRRGRVAPRLHQRLLRVHHARARLVPQRLGRLGVHLELHARRASGLGPGLVVLPVVAGGQAVAAQASLAHS